MATANFSYLSSPETDDAAVDAIVSQTIDLAVLEQIAAPNSCHHLSDSVLPTDLETRFRKLKSFPAADPKPITTSLSLNSEEERRPKSLDRRGSSRPPSFLNSEPMGKIKHEILSPNRAGDEGVISSSPARRKDGMDLDSKLRNGHGSSPPKPKVVRELETKLRSGFGSSPSISPVSSRDSPSPPRQVCCFGCSAKKGSRKKGSGDVVITSSGLFSENWGKNDEVLSDLSTFSLKEQRRRMKKALKEELKLSREAEEVVKSVRHASARFDVSTIDELVSGGEEKIKVRF